MASINHLEMCDQLKALPEIEIKKTCFGLFTQAVYKPSQSVIKVNQHEYSVEVGGQLEKLLNGGNNTIMEQRNKGKKYSKSDMGNMRLDTCISKDRQFVGAQLLLYAATLVIKQIPLCNLNCNSLLPHNLSLLKEVEYLQCNIWLKRAVGTLHQILCNKCQSLRAVSLKALQVRLHAALNKIGVEHSWVLQRQHRPYIPYTSAPIV